MTDRDESAAVRVVEAWHVALNAGDVDRLVGLSDPEIEVGGPRGGGTGRQLLRDWVERAKIRLEPLRIVPREGAIVVEQRATWEEADPDETSTVASTFVVHDGRVTSVLRYDDLEDALRAAGSAGVGE